MMVNVRYDNITVIVLKEKESSIRDAYSCLGCFKILLGEKKKRSVHKCFGVPDTISGICFEIFQKKKLGNR